MKIKIKPLFNRRDIRKMMYDLKAQHRANVIAVLTRVGWEAVNEARTNASYHDKDYTDRTANLRNSIGFVIAENGKVIEQEFSITAHGNKPSREKPLKIGKAIATEVAQNTSGLALIVVAGMKYSVYVESRGYVVLTGAEEYARRKVPELLRKIYS